MRWFEDSLIESTEGNSILASARRHQAMFGKGDGCYVSYVHAWRAHPELTSTTDMGNSVSRQCEDIFWKTRVHRRNAPGSRSSRLDIIHLSGEERETAGSVLLDHDDGSPSDTLADHKSTSFQTPLQSLPSYWLLRITTPRRRCLVKSVSQGHPLFLLPCPVSSRCGYITMGAFTWGGCRGNISISRKFGHSPAWFDKNRKKC